MWSRDAHAELERGDTTSAKLCIADLPTLAGPVDVLCFSDVNVVDARLKLLKKVCSRIWVASRSVFAFRGIKFCSRNGILYHFILR